MLTISIIIIIAIILICVGVLEDTEEYIKQELHKRLKIKEIDNIMDDIRLSVKQIKEMRHAIGNDFSKDSYRNYYNTSVNSESWNELVELGLAIKQDRERQLGGIYYFLTEAGLDVLKEIIGVNAYPQDDYDGQQTVLKRKLCSYWSWY